MDITREIAAKVLATVDAGLVAGMGVPEPGKMCVEAAVCYAMGLPHSDNPTCVAPALRRLKIRLNDARWSSPQARAQGMRRLALAQLGSAGHLDERVFSARVVEMTIRTVVPPALRVAAKRVPSHATTLEAAALDCERLGDRASAQRARDAAAAAYASYADAAAAADIAAYAAAAYVAAAYAAYASYADAADIAAYAAAYASYADAAAAAAAADIAAYAAADAAYADAAAAADIAAYAAADERVLEDYAERVVQILIDMQAPGCQWLDLA